MRRDAVSRLVVALLLAAPSARPETLPDFAGQWTLVPETSAAGVAMGSAPATLSAHGTMGSGWGADITLTQDAEALTVEYTYFHPRDVQPPLTFKYLLNGSESRNTVDMGRGPQEQISKAAWEGATLVITTRHSFVNPRDGQTLTSETRQALTLAAPDSLVIETSRSGAMGGKPSSTRTVYKKRPRP